MKIGKKTLVRRIVLFLGMALAIAAAFVTFKTWRARVRFERELAALRDAGEPLVIDDLRKTLEGAASGQGELTVYEALRSVREELRRVDDELAKTKFGQETDGIYQDRLLTATGAEELRKILDLAPNASAALRAAGDAARLGAPIDDASLDVNSTGHLEPLQEYRSATRFLLHRCDLLLFDDEREKACETALVMLRLSRRCDDHPSLVGYLTGIAVRGMGCYSLNQVLRTGDLPRESRDRIDAELAACERELDFDQALRSERVVGLRAFRELPGFSRPAWWIREDAVSYLAMMRGEIAAANSPYHEYARAQPSEPLGTLTKLLVPAIDACRIATNRTLANVRCLRALNQLQAIDASSGDEADILSRLGLDASSLTDPFDGQPLRVKRVAGRWVVYSVGENLRDDQGDARPMKGDIVAGAVTH